MLFFENVRVIYFTGRKLSHYVARAGVLFQNSFNRMLIFALKSNHRSSENRNPEGIQDSETLHAWRFFAHLLFVPSFSIKLKTVDIVTSGKFL